MCPSSRGQWSGWRMMRHVNGYGQVERREIRKVGEEGLWGLGFIPIQLLYPQGNWRSHTHIPSIGKNLVPYCKVDQRGTWMWQGEREVKDSGIICIEPTCLHHWRKHAPVPYQNSECRSYEVTLKAGCQGYGMSGVTGSVGVYNIGARTRPQLIGCALASRTGCP